MSSRSLTWPQVNAWRLAQHYLSNRLPRPDFLQAVTRTGGIQAQVMSAAVWGLGARVEGLVPQDIQAALWLERSLVKTWAMRATLHLIAAQDLPLYVAARSYDTRNWVGFFDYYGVNQSKYEAFLAVAPQILSSQPMTRDQFAAAAAREVGIPELQEVIETKGWGTPLKPLAWRGELCFGPSQGQNVTFVNPRKWLGSWQSLEPFPSVQEIARRYLRAFGPAKAENFALWWGGGSSLVLARKVFKSLAAELEEVNVEGWHAFALRSTLEPMQALQPPKTVNLLPLFDAYVMGVGRGAEIAPLLPAAFQPLVYRPQGWISAVVLVDGCMCGVWEMKAQHNHAVLQVRMFAPPAPATVRGIEAEAARMGSFINSNLQVEFLD